MLIARLKWTTLVKPHDGFDHLGFCLHVYVNKFLKEYWG